MFADLDQKICKSTLNEDDDQSNEMCWNGNDFVENKFYQTSATNQPKPQSLSLSASNSNDKEDDTLAKRLSEDVESLELRIQSLLDEKPSIQADKLSFQQNNHQGYQNNLSNQKPRMGDLSNDFDAETSGSGANPICDDEDSNNLPSCGEGSGEIPFTDETYHRLPTSTSSSNDIDILSSEPPFRVPPKDNNPDLEDDQSGSSTSCLHISTLLILFMISISYFHPFILYS